jgi:asparagine synthase (glutamine-hydrolysing)
MLKKLKTAYHAAKDFGFKWTLRRVFYEFQLRSGHHKRNFPKRLWRENELDFWLKDGFDSKDILKIWLDTEPRFFFSAQNKTQIAEAIIRLNNSNPEALEDLKKTDINYLTYFTKLKYKVIYPDIWFTNPFLDPPVKVASDLHWSEYPVYSKEYEDIKFLWEPGRFSIVYDLVRAYFLTNDEKFPRQYWELIENWIDHNPPNTGPHWKCGQETSLRLMAWYFGLFAFLESPETTPARFSKMLGSVGAQAHRVSKDLEYSFLQHSNHAISEGLGLYVTGLLFPQFKESENWKKIGFENLSERALYLIRPDGTYLQKSHNYLRFILHAYLYILPLAEANGEVFPDNLKERLKVALAYLKTVLDEKSGKTPNFGSNDGALIFPINSCDFTDFRSLIGAWHYYFFQEKLFEDGPWNEDLVWLFGVPSHSPSSSDLDKNKVRRRVNSPPDKGIHQFEKGGIYTVRGENSWAFMHAETFKDRPAHADALHVDLWWRGLNICIDPGTYLYYGHTPWLDAYKHTYVHNTVTVDGKDQMERAYRFTWGHWHNCKVNAVWENEFSRGIELEHNGFERLKDPVIHRRAVLNLEGDFWIVIDDLVGEGEHELTLHWLVNDFPMVQNEDGIQLNTPEGKFEVKIFGGGTFEIIQGDPEKGIFGLKSNYYGVIEPAISVKNHWNGKLPKRLISCFGSDKWQIELDKNNIIRASTSNKSIELVCKDVGRKNIVQKISAD